MKKKKPITKLQELKAQQGHLSPYYDIIGRDSTDGDIFAITRKVQFDANDQGFEVSNLVEVYMWLLTYRNSL